jgi:general secretion pathway protein K
MKARRRHPNCPPGNACASRNLARARQRGAALLTAMIIVSLVSTMAAAMVWQQFRAVQIEAAERARTQSALILQGALDWARLILREDARANMSNPIDHLGEVWATPLAEARLSTFLAADNANSADGPEAFLSGSIADAQSRYNLRNLVGGDEKARITELRAMERICDSVGVPTDTASQLAAALSLALGPKTPELNPPLAPRDIDQLAWLGLNPGSLARLRPLVTLLPVPTPLNLNTASRELLATVFEGMDLASAERIVRARQDKPFRDLTEILPLVPAAAMISSQRGSFNSSFFEVRGRLRLEARVLEERSLVQRRGLDVVSISMRRQNLTPEAP